MRTYSFVIVTCKRTKACHVSYYKRKSLISSLTLLYIFSFSPLLPFVKDFDWTMHGWPILGRTSSQLHACVYLDSVRIMSESTLAILLLHFVPYLAPRATRAELLPLSPQNLSPPQSSPPPLSTPLRWRASREAHAGLRKAAARRFFFHPSSFLSHSHPGVKP